MGDGRWEMGDGLASSSAIMFHPSYRNRVSLVMLHCEMRGGLEHGRPRPSWFAPLRTRRTNAQILDQCVASPRGADEFAAGAPQTTGEGARAPSPLLRRGPFRPRHLVKPYRLVRCSGYSVAFGQAFA